MKLATQNLKRKVETINAIVKLVLTTLAAMEAARKMYRTIHCARNNELKTKRGSADMESVTLTALASTQKSRSRRNGRLRMKQ